MFWKLAKVEELLPGKDGNIRGAVIKVSNAFRNPRLLKRKVKHLFPLEVSDNDDIDRAEVSEAEPTSISPVCETPNISANTRPRRNAAMVGEIMRRFRTFDNFCIQILARWFTNVTQTRGVCHETY